MLLHRFARIFGIILRFNRINYLKNRNYKRVGGVDFMIRGYNKDSKN